MPTLAQWFTGANLFVLPFWTLMILLPNWDWTRRVMTSLVPFIALALLYTGLFITAITPGVGSGTLQSHAVGHC